VIRGTFGARAWRRLAPFVLLVVLVAAGLTAPQVGATTQARARTAADNMGYNAGSVMLQNTVYVVWWDAGVGFASGADDQTAYEHRAEDFLKGLEGSQYYHLLNQYYETVGASDRHVGPYTKFGGSVQDFTPPVANGNQISATTIGSEVTKEINANGWSSGSSTVVVVFTPTGYVDCKSGQCTEPAGGNCAFHDSVDGTPYVAVPPPSNDLTHCGAQYYWPVDPGHVDPDNLWVQSGPAKSGDASINAMSHELFEAITDPFGNAWHDGSGPALGELGDKCAYHFDPFWVLSGHTIRPILASDQAQDGTVTLDGQNFVAQKEWSNSDGGCVMSDPPLLGAKPQAATATMTKGNGDAYQPGTWTNQDVAVTAHGADDPNGLGLNELDVSTNGSTSTSLPFAPDDGSGNSVDDGIHVTATQSVLLPVHDGKSPITVIEHSYSGQRTTTDVGEVWQDKTAPTVDLTAPTPDSPTGWYTSPSELPVPVEINPSDNLSGIDDSKTSCMLDGSPVTITDGTEVDVDSNGAHEVSCRVTDLAGNTSTPIEPTPVLIDTTSGPSVTVTPPAPVSGTNGWFDGSDTLPVNVAVAASKPSGGSNVTSIDCSLDGSPVSLTDTSGIGTSTSASGTEQVTPAGSHTVSCTATDETGETSSPVTAPVKIDTQAPTLSGSPTTSANANGWYNHDVVIHWTCGDDLSGVAGSCPANDTISQEGTNLTVQHSISDVAGNSTTSTSTAVNVDKTAPVVTVVTPSVIHGTNGWFNSQDTLPVQVGVTANDSVGGASGVSTIDCTLDGSPVAIVAGKVAVSGYGIHHLSCTSTDKAGNTSSTGAVGSTATVKIDATAPFFSAALNPANPSGTGWYNAATGAPTASYTCTDATSGLAVSCPSPYTFPQGANQTSSRTITDQAGNSSTVAVGPLNVDLTFPSCTATPTPAKLPPQNKTLVPVSVALGLTYDTISGAGSTVLSSLTTNEGDIGKESSGWVIGTQSTSGKLLATHDPNDGKGRVYTFTYGITNKAGNAKSCVTTVTVPDVGTWFAKKH
jgi:hypothetical protein